MKRRPCRCADLHATYKLAPGGHSSLRSESPKGGSQISTRRAAKRSFTILNMMLDMMYIFNAMAKYSFINPKFYFYYKSVVSFYTVKIGKKSNIRGDLVAWDTGMNVANG